MPFVPAIIGGAAVLGAAGISYYSASKSRKDAKSAQKSTEYYQDESLNFERMKWDVYQKDLESRIKALETDRYQRSLLAERKYAAGLSDWKIKTAALDETIGMWEDYEADPTSVPAWKSFRDSIYKEATKQTKQLGGQMERAGRVGGAQDRMRQDVSTALTSKLGSEMLKIQETARGKQLELEGARPAEPFLEYYGDPEANIQVSQYAGSFPSYQSAGIQGSSTIDATGLGMAMAQIADKWPTNEPYTQPMTDFTWRTPATFGQSSATLTPRQQTLGV